MPSSSIFLNCDRDVGLAVEVSPFHLLLYIDTELLKNRFGQLDYSMSKDTVRQDSLGQQELIYLYKSKFG